MVDEDFVEDFEEQEVLLLHVNVNQGWEIHIGTLVDRVAGVTTDVISIWRLYLPGVEPGISR